MKDKSISGSHSQKTGMRQAEKAVGIIERAFITICLAAILFFIISRYVPISEEHGSTILFGGIAIIIVIVMVEALLFEKRRHQH